MSRCVQPLAGWWSAKPNDLGHHYVAFGLHAGCADKPVNLPCGKCVGCIQDRAQDWSVRCYHESVMHERNSFVTLTYADPAPPHLDKSDLQRFFKRVRKSGIAFRYFAVGELGGLTRRPHYHAIFFGQDFRDGSHELRVGEKSDKPYYFNPELTDLWGHGHVTIAAADPGSIFYCAGYSLKNLDCPEAFHLSSRRPFIGSAWLSRNWDDVCRLGFVTIEGQKYRVPATYLARKELAVEFDPLKDRRRVYQEGRPPELAGKAGLTARSREINIRAAAASRRGDL